jgi:pimeloyl-ACP methyl ester carboxylesterase
VRWLLRDRFPVADPKAGSDVPTVVVYGDRDSVVPTRLSEEVARRAGNLVDEVVLHADHNDPVMFGPRIADAAVRLAEKLER